MPNPEGLTAALAAEHERRVQAHAARVRQEAPELFDPENQRSGKLTHDEVREIRRRYAAGELPREIAAHYSLTPQSLYNVATRRSYRNLP